MMNALFCFVSREIIKGFAFENTLTMTIAFDVDEWIPCFIQKCAILFLKLHLELERRTICFSI